MEVDETVTVVEMGLRGDDQSVVPLDKAWAVMPRGKVQYVVLYRQLPETHVNFTVQKINATRRSVSCQECNNLSLHYDLKQIEEARNSCMEHTRHHWNTTFGLKDRSELPEALQGYYQFNSIDVLQVEGRQYQQRLIDAAEEYRQAVIAEAEMSADVRLVRATSVDPERLQSMGYKMTAASAHVQNTKHTLLNYILAGGE